MLFPCIRHSMPTGKSSPLKFGSHSRCMLESKSPQHDAACMGAKGILPTPNLLPRGPRAAAEVTVASENSALVHHYQPDTTATRPGRTHYHRCQTVDGMNLKLKRCLITQSACRVSKCQFPSRLTGLWLWSCAESTAYPQGIAKQLPRMFAA